MKSVPASAVPFAVSDREADLAACHLSDETVNVNTVVSPLLPSSIVTLPIDSAAISSFWIVPMAVSSPIVTRVVSVVPNLASDNLSSKVSSSSTRFLAQPPTP